MTDTSNPLSKDIVCQEEIPTLELQAMSQDDLLARLNEYRKMVDNGQKFDKTTHANALKILRQARHKAVAANPKASKKAKAAVAPKFDLGAFLN